MMANMPPEVWYIDLLFDRPDYTFEETERLVDCILSLSYVKEINTGGDWLIKLDVKKFYSIHGVIAEIKNILEKPICPICAKPIVYKQQIQRTGNRYHQICFMRTAKQTEGI